MSFTENPENYDTLVMAQHIDAQLQECIALERKLGTFDREMALDARYVHRVRERLLLIDQFNNVRLSPSSAQVLGSGLEEDPLFHDEAIM